MDPGYRTGGVDEAARHKHSRASCSGTVVTMPRGKPDTRGCQGTELPTVGKRVHCTHPTVKHSRAACIEREWEERQLWVGWRRRRNEVPVVLGLPQ